MELRRRPASHGARGGCRRAKADERPRCARGQAGERAAQDRRARRRGGRRTASLYSARAGARAQGPVARADAALRSSARAGPPGRGRHECRRRGERGGRIRAQTGTGCGACDPASPAGVEARPGRVCRGDARRAGFSRERAQGAHCSGAGEGYEGRGRARPGDEGPDGERGGAGAEARPADCSTGGSSQAERADGRGAAGLGSA